MHVETTRAIAGLEYQKVIVQRELQPNQSTYSFTKHEAEELLKCLNEGIECLERVLVKL